MDSSQFFVPALVAALVTLTIEYFAKPGLDARKERNLERSRRRRDAILTHQRCLHNLVAQEDLAQAEDLSTSTREGLEEESERLRAEVEQDSAALYRLSTSFAGSDPLEFEYLTATAGALRGAVMSGRADSELLSTTEHLELLIWTSLSLLEARRWSIGTLRLRHEAREQIHEIHSRSG